MTSQELRQKYLDFFSAKGGSASGGKGHTIIPSASLIPENDPTVLFTTAGMHPLVPYLLGEEHPGGKRLVSCQKCIRTGDIDEVGDDVHLTFFEMLGNWSLGDYWKKEAIEWSFEFLTKELKLPINKLAVSCFAGDNDAPRDSESTGIWKSLGIPENRIYFLGKKDNWWGPAGLTGPCGPDTEMFYWTGKGEPPDLVTGDNKEGWVEIWNDVFMQYNKTAYGKFEPLKQRNVDTGMGLERTLAVLNGHDNVFAIQEFEPIIFKIKELASKQDEKAVRIIADHIKAAVFIIGDPRGISSSNVGQGYVVRRLIRRAIRYGKLLGVKDNFVVSVAEVVISRFKDIYPELLQNEEFIVNELKTEEEKFSKTLEKGLREFSKLSQVNGKIAFDLYQSCGFPLELIEELSRERGFKIDKNDFEQEFKKHQELSRTASAGKFKGGLADNSEIVVKYHTATHLLHQALRQVLGDNVAQKGSNITAERLRFDFSHPSKMTSGEINQVEEIVNSKISEDLPVHFEILSVEEAKSRGAIGLFEDKYAKLGNQVKVYFVGDYSVEICGGPHIEHTGQIGSFKIVKEEAVAAGIRRVKAVVNK
ncbi:MAG: alanine--tRNA ligase [Patescibacteria group bacterium]